MLVSPRVLRPVLRRIASRRFVVLLFAVGVTGLFGPIALAGPSSIGPQGPQDSGSADRDLRLARGYYREGFTDRAVDHLKRVVEAGRPAQREEALFLLADCRRAQEDFESAARNLGTLLRDFPTSARRASATLLRGEYLLRAGEVQPAIKALESLLAPASALRSSLEESERGAGWFWLAEARQRNQDRAGSALAYGRLIDEHPRHELRPFAIYNLATLQREAGQVTEASSTLAKLPEAEIPAALRDSVFLLRGDLAQERGSSRESLVEYARVGPGSQRAAALVGSCWAARELGDSAAFESARAELAGTPSALEEREEVDLLGGAWAAEVGDVARADALLTPHRTGARATEAAFWLGWAHLQKAQFVEAAQIFGSAASGSDSWAERSAYRRVEALVRAKDWLGAREAAAAFVARVPAADPRRPDVLVAQVEANYRLERDDDVSLLANDFLAAFPHHPQLAKVLRFVAESDLRTKRWASAASAFRSLKQRAESPAERLELAVRLAHATYRNDPSTCGDELQTLLEEVKRDAQSHEGGAAFVSEVALLLGRARLAAGDKRGAEAAFGAAASADPSGSVTEKARLEEALLQVGSRDEDSVQRGVATLTALVAESSKSSVRGRASRELAAYFARTGDFASAIRYYEAFLSTEPAPADRAESELALSFCQWRSGAADDAWRSFERLTETISANPEVASLDGLQGEALHLEARLLKDRGSPVALSKLELYRREHPRGARMAEVLRVLADLHLAAENSEPAREVLQVLVDDFDQASSRERDLYDLSWLKLQAGDTADARSGFEQLLDERPGGPLVAEAHFRLAEIDYEASRLAEARSHYQKTLALDESARLVEPSLYRIGWSHWKEEAWSEARVAFAGLAERFPQSDLAGESLLLAARACQKLGSPESLTDEQRLLERFVSEHSNHELASEGAVRWAELLVADQKWQRARETLERFSSTKLEGVLLARRHLAMGKSLRGLDALESALSHFDRAVDGGDRIAAEAQFAKGSTYRQLGQEQEAIDAFMSGAFLYPVRPWVLRSYLEAGRGLHDLGRAQEARRLWQRVVDEGEDGEWSREALRLIEGAKDSSKTTEKSRKREDL